ncbi:hypothetical protein VTP01DRAFT_9412 [Rhizomucor pusillus]|uniref:uncharacterized protein n=1 Tax=Rhizomucor pusillus TaxID=4840 RepID=UPI00374411C8
MFLLLLLQNRVISRVWIVQEPCEATKLSLPLAHPYLLWSAAVIFSTRRSYYVLIALATSQNKETCENTFIFLTAAMYRKVFHTRLTCGLYRAVEMIQLERKNYDGILSHAQHIVAGIKKNGAMLLADKFHG